MFSRKIFWAAAFMLLAAGPLSASVAPRYALTFLPNGFEPGPFHPMNNAGRIVGTYQGRVAIYDRGGIHPVTAPPGAGSGINDRSDVARRLSGTDTAFAIIGGRLVDIHATLPTLYYTSDGEVMNNRGSVAGIADPFADEAVRGFLYHHGHSELVPTLGGDFSFITGLNNKDAVVGWASTGGGSVNDQQDHAILYKGGKVHDLVLTGTLALAAGADDDDGMVPCLHPDLPGADEWPARPTGAGVAWVCSSCVKCRVGQQDTPRAAARKKKRRAARRQARRW